ncbi:hypothetical protein YC2023_116443 [Brassica napus]
MSITGPVHNRPIHLERDDPTLERKRRSNPRERERRPRDLERRERRLQLAYFLITVPEIYRPSSKKNLLAHICTYETKLKESMPKNTNYSSEKHFVKKLEIHMEFLTRILETRGDSEKKNLDSSMYCFLIDALLLAWKAQSAFWILGEAHSMGQEIHPNAIIS